MDENNVVAQADVTQPAPEPVAEKTEHQAEAPVEAPKPSREDELQRAVAAANQARRRAERDLAEQRLQWETANQRLEQIAKRFQPEERVPDPQEDPVGALAHKSDRIDKRLEEWEQRELHRQQQEYAQRAQQHVERQWAMASQAFVQKQPDFPQAYDYLFRNAMEEFTEAGYDEMTAGQLVQGYWRDIVARSQQDGVNPAERMYSLAKRRGFKSAKAETKIDTIANGTKAASPLATASGKAPSRLTAETIANMSEEDFNKLSDADFKRVFS